MSGRAPIPVLLHGVTYAYGEGELRRPVLREVDLAVDHGEIVLLTGPSGSGKTTLLTLIGALRAMQMGSARVLGEELRGASEAARVKLRRRIGFIFQNHNLLGFLPARQNVAMALEQDGALAEGARLVVLRGRGRNFCTGLDLSDLETAGEGDLALRIIRIELLLQRIHALPVSTMAVAGGRVFGAGADLFAVCDHRVALAGSSFAFPGPAFGLVLGTARLAGLIGDGAARRLLLSGATVEAEAALQLGLATAMAEHAAGPIALAHAAASRLDPATVAALHGRTRRADDAGDLAALRCLQSFR
jgi:enoyl-CoA hydratase/carnithine racemase